uniref:PH domain-containing protein n=1 Tax=Hemiselmis andersenii TaxID=464988 RepID=A0A7S0TYH4_HEMAN
MIWCESTCMPSGWSDRSVMLANGRSVMLANGRYEMGGYVPRSENALAAPSGAAEPLGYAPSYAYSDHKVPVRILQKEKEFRARRRHFSGTLFAFDGPTEQWRRRHFTLQDSTLTYSQTYSDASGQGVEGAPPVSIDLFSSARCQVARWPMYGRGCCFTVTPMDGADAFLLSASSEGERAGWIDRLDAAGVSVTDVGGEKDVFGVMKTLGLPSIPWLS